VMRGQTGQSLSTKQALNMLNQIRSKAGAYSDVVELIDQHIDSLEGFGDEPSRKTREASWADMTPEEQERWRKEAEVRATEARKQLQTEVGREVGYMDQDMWEVIMPTESLYHWTLPFPRGGFPQTPRLRETRKSIYYAPGWLKIRAYGAQNPHLTVGQIAKDLGYSRGYVGNSLHGRFPADGSYLGPRIHVFRDERTTKAFETMVERYGGEKAERAAEEIRAEVIQAYQEHPDLSADEIAVIFNISATALYNWLREAGIERRMVGHAGPELKAKVAQTYTDRPDLTVEEIAEMYGISDQSVVNWRREAGIERRFRMPSPEERAEAVQMYLDRPDLTVEEIAEIYGVHDRTVNIWVREAEVGRRGTGFKKPSFPALSGLSRYAADIQMLVS
jgi:transposase-like protein